eukprot:4044162-Amphidinium_carterae.2
MTQFTDLARHAATQGVCHDIHWSNQAPEGFAEFIETCAASDDASIHLAPPFAAQFVTPPPALMKRSEAVDDQG